MSKEENSILNEITIHNFSSLINSFTVNKQYPHCNPILQQWKNNKEHIYQLFGNELVLKFPVKLNSTKLQQQFARDNFRKKSSHDIIYEIDNESLIKNSLQKDLVFDGKRFPKGMKISRIFQKVLKHHYYNDKSIATEYSNLLQSLYVTGNLCISIDPLDFLTMSDSGYKWSSCHGLKREFRGGLLSLLTDSSTIVCYLESCDSYFLLGDVIVKKKKWRQLAHINQDHSLIIFNTQYPFNNHLAFEKLIGILETILDTKCYLHSINPNDIKLIDFIKDYNSYPEEPLHFNDLFLRKNNGKYENQEIHILSKEKEIIPKRDIIVGNVPLCPVCGERIVAVSKSLECNICDPLENCCTCATPFHKEELHFIDSELYCDTCFDNEFTYCEKCDEIVRRTWIEYGHHSCQKVQIC